MKKRLLRLSKKILILTLCTTLLSGSVINRYKITANATFEDPFVVKREYCEICNEISKECPCLGWEDCTFADVVKFRFFVRSHFRKFIVRE